MLREPVSWSPTCQVIRDVPGIGHQDLSLRRAWKILCEGGGTRRPAPGRLIEDRADFANQSIRRKRFLCLWPVMADDDVEASAYRTTLRTSANDDIVWKQGARSKRRRSDATRIPGAK